MQRRVRARLRSNGMSMLHTLALAILFAAPPQPPADTSPPTEAPPPTEVPVPDRSTQVKAIADKLSTVADEAADVEWNLQYLGYADAVKRYDKKCPPSSTGKRALTKCSRRAKRLKLAAGPFLPGQPAHPRDIDSLSDTADRKVAALPEARKFAGNDPLGAAKLRAETAAKTAADKQSAASSARAEANAAMLVAQRAGGDPRAPVDPARAAEAVLLDRQAKQAEEAAKAAKDDAAAALAAFLTYKAKHAADEAKVADSEARIAGAGGSAEHAVKAELALRNAEIAAKAAQDPGVSAAEAENKKDTGEKDTGEKDTGEKTAAEKELDQLKAGKLIRWGITAGVAPALYQPLAYHKTSVSTPGMGALTYIMLHPGYWRNQPETNIYCANRWGGVQSEAAAAAAADDLSSDRAKLIVDRILASEKAGSLVPDEVLGLMCTDGSCVDDEGAVRTLAKKANGTGEEAEAARKVLISKVQRTTYSWTSGISARCGSRMVGMWFGYPLKFTATVPYQTPTEDGPVVRRHRLDVTPLFATGIGVSPNAYISLLAGISLGKVNLPPGTDRDDELAVSFVFGLGGNLDLLGFLTK